MSYRNQHQLHRSDQVWNRDIRHSDEEDYNVRSYPSAYSPGYSSHGASYNNSYPQGSDYGDANQSYRQERDYDNRRFDRYDTDRRSTDRWDLDRDRYDDYNRGDYYDYRSGELRDHSQYDRNVYNNRLDDYGSSYNRYDQQRYQDSRYNDRSSNNGDRDWWERSKDEVKSWFGDDDAERRREQDRRMTHRGKGPKGYMRSDERIREDVSDRLSDDHDVDASEIDVEVSGGEVILKGSVNSRAEKRRAEDIAESVSGVKNVENRLRCTNTNGGFNMNRYTGTTDDVSGIGSSSGTTSEITRDVKNNRERGV